MLSSSVLSNIELSEDLAKETGGDSELDKQLDNIPEGERASIGGPVDAGITYKEWFGEQTKEKQLEILGPELFDKHEQGKLTKELESSRIFTHLDPKDYVTIMDMEKFDSWAEKMKEHYDALREKYKDDILAIRKEMPKSSIVIHGLPPQAQNMLGTKIETMLFSADSFAKQLYKHPELAVTEYQNVFSKIRDSKELYPSKSLHIILIARNKGDFYRIVIKTTESRIENYILSLHQIKP